jgi:hypothetical protein
MKRITPHIISLIVFIFLRICCFAQSGVTVRASINRDKIMIGEPVELKLEAVVPADTEAAWFPVDSMAHFELIDKGKIDTVVNAAGKTFRQTLVITSFDSGRWALPSLPLTIGNREYLTDSLPISVAYSNFDPQKDYHDIKEIVEVENTATAYIHWIVLGMAVLSLLGVVYFLRKKVSRPKVPAVSIARSALSPLQEAIQALDELKEKGYADNTSTKKFHTGLSDILRWYLYRRANMATMEKTSGELMVQLKELNLPAASFTPLAQVLRMNDAVKFAKYQPPAAENEEALAIIKQSIQQLDTIII